MARIVEWAGIVGRMIVGLILTFVVFAIIGILAVVQWWLRGPNE